MTPIDPISPSWLSGEGTQAVMAALEAARPGGSRFVGGCVRNVFRGTTQDDDDIDIATQLEPPATMAALQAAGIRALPTGIEHGTITAIYKSRPFEITTLRRDVETDGRRAVVAFTEDWAEDAARRDFRLNALYADLNGQVFEPIAQGVSDALSGRVIFIGDADERLREDYLRILRFFRFNAWYGETIDPDGLAACARQMQGLDKIAAERIWKELKKLLTAPDPSAAVLAMEESGVLEQVLPGTEAGGLVALCEAEKRADLSADPMRRVMALLPRRGREVDAMAARLKLSNEEHRRLSAWASAGMDHVEGLAPQDLHAAIYAYGPEAVADRAVLEAAQTERTGYLAAHLEIIDDWRRPVFPVGGDDALAAGLIGPEIGEALRAAEAAWIDSDFTMGRTELLALIKRPD
ncbi:CCA tRNA nucleotidyltransferase [Hyphomonas oceanitis]|uniref:tRNA nucleotidyltransferase/poly(A) polymerase family protein n=1 Tax=Hyphomonas oceanitis SCH89 TaxID=1280953 RepID=A0A059GCJ0_9PROT|nr:CCA tRNA nucleotidyltransferase [Hyphomonas oceanitis]KDA04439.1 tRNA nucleotidyltransferase/poly(A) polymerase family protein [Hyphomonas oceanitis SCH89]